MELKGLTFLCSSRLGFLLAGGLDRDRHNHSHLR
jgi:hypothetical protein